MKWLRPRTFVWAAIALAIIAGAFIAIRGQAIPVEVGQPQRLTICEYIVEDGRTRLGQQYVVDLPVSGTVERIALEVGDVVNAGDVIVRVDPYPLEQRKRELEAMIAQARARVVGVDVAKPKSEDIETAAVRITEMQDSLDIARKQRSVLEYELGQAERDFERAKKLLEDDVVSHSFYDEAEVRYKGLIEQQKRAMLEEDAATKALRMAELAHERIKGSIDDNEYQRVEQEGQIEALQAQLALLENDLEKTEVRAPVTGPVIEKMIENRRVLAAGTPLIEIGDLRSIEIECDVLSEEVTAVNVGQEVEISGKALADRVIAGKVSRIYPAGFMKVSALGVEQQRVKTIIAFDNESANLRPGTSVDVRIITAESKDALTVPDRAVFRQDGKWSIFIINNGRAELRSVEVGLRNDEHAEIISGLTEKDEIVTEPKNELADGARISRL